MQYTYKKYTPYFLITPAILIILLLYAYPIFLIIINSFEKVSIISDSSSFIGLDNFKKIFLDGSFYSTMILTIKYTLVTVALKIIIGFIMALFLSSDIYFSKLLRFLTLIPWAIQQVTVAIVWKWILDGNYGYLNYFLEKLHIIESNVHWLSSPNSAFFCAAFVDAWMGVSLVSMIFLTALNSIDNSLYESAKVDGANILESFMNITLPSIKKVLLVTITLVTIWTFNSFNVIFILTGGGPMRSTETIIIRIYQEAFSKFDIGVSSALSLIVFILLILFSAVYLKLIMNMDKES